MHLPSVSLDPCAVLGPSPGATWILPVWIQYPWIQPFQQYCTYVLHKYCSFWAKVCNTTIQLSCNTAFGRVSESIHVSMRRPVPPSASRTMPARHRVLHEANFDANPKTTCRGGSFRYGPRGACFWFGAFLNRRERTSSISEFRIPSCVRRA